MPSAQGSLIAPAFVVGSAAVAHRGIPRWDRSMFVAINSLPGHLQYPLWAPMQAGSLGGALGTGLLVGLRRDRNLGLEIAVAGTVAWLAAKAIKAAVGRERPSKTVGSTQLRLGAAESGLGFPSGHAALAMTSATLLGRSASRRHRLTLGAVPALVGFSRIHVGAHYPLDVLGGWALGLAVADATSRSFARFRTEA